MKPIGQQRGGNLLVLVYLYVVRIALPALCLQAVISILIIPVDAYSEGIQVIWDADHVPVYSTIPVLVS